MKSKFPERLYELRRDMNLSLMELSRKIKISNATLCRWENGVSDVNGAGLIKLASFFKVSADYLLGIE
jgi:transcriptional regulator with XRE-family HTH domain